MHNFPDSSKPLSRHQGYGFDSQAMHEQMIKNILSSRFA